MDDPVFTFPTPAKADKAEAGERGRGPIPDLKMAMRRARVEEAERSGAVAELRGAEMARLEMLRDALEPVFAQLPKDASMFDLGLVPGEKPRLFIDMVAYIELDRDRRTFRLIQDARAGRFVVAESERIGVMSEAVTAYLGRRLVERERALAGEVRLPDATTPAAPPPAAEALPAKPATAPTMSPAKAYGRSDMLFALAMGLVIGALLILLAGWIVAQGGLTGLGWPGLRAMTGK